MRIAYLILCHKNQRQIDRLISQLDDGNCEFFVHIDKKSKNLSPSFKDNIHLVEEAARIDVKWATISMVEATIELVKCALRYQDKFDYYCLISGQDFPIKNNKYIQSFLAKNNGTNFIEVLHHDDPLFLRYCKRNDLYYPDWMFSRKTSIKILKRLYIYITGGYNRTYRFLKRKYPVEIKFEYGSQWWCLTHEALEWIYELISKKKALCLFNNSMTPDECVFQTLFMVSPYKNKREDKLSFLEWNEALNNPRILKTSDLNMLLENETCLFARKFDSDVDDGILTELETHLKEV